MWRLRLFQELFRDYGMIVVPCLLGLIYFGTVMRGWWVRHEALGVGAAACATEGHDEEWCADAASKNGQECLSLILPTRQAGPRRVAMPTTDGFDSTTYVRCLELTPDGWVRAKLAAAEAARAPLKERRAFP
jgi:hypothetical protein